VFLKIHIFEKEVIQNEISKKNYLKITLWFKNSSSFAFTLQTKLRGKY